MPGPTRFVLSATETERLRTWLQAPSGALRLTTGLSAEAVEGGGLDVIVADPRQRKTTVLLDEPATGSPA